MLEQPRDISATVTRDSIIIFVAGMVLFLLAQPAEFIGFNARFGLFAREMLHYGPGFFPTVYHQPYPDYPASSTFLIYLIARCLPGGLTPTIAVIPSAMAASFVMVITYRLAVLAAVDINCSRYKNKPLATAVCAGTNADSNIGVNVDSNANIDVCIDAQRWGWYAVLLMLLTVPFFTDARSISLDIYTTLITLLSFYVVYSADVLSRREGVSGRAGKLHNQRRIWLIPVLLAAGFCMRGPVGTVIPTAVICSYYFRARQYRKMVIAALVAVVVFALCSWLMLLAARHQGGKQLQQQVTRAQLTGRLQGNKDYPNDHSYYLLRCPVVYAVSCPLAILVVLAGFRNILTGKNREYQFLGYMACWVIIVIAGMSIPAAKKMRYVLPVVPALCVLAACMFVHVPIARWLINVRRFFVNFCYIFALYGSLGIVVVLVLLKLFAPQLTSLPELQPLGDVFNYGTVILLIMLAVCVVLIYRKIKLTANRDMFCVGAAVLCFAVINTGLVERVAYMREQTHSFVRKLEALQSKAPGHIVFYKVGPDQEDIKYAVDSSHLIIPGFIRNADDIFNQPPATYFITRQSRFKKLPPQITRRLKLLFTGKIGHTPSVVFQRSEIRNSSLERP